MPAAGDFTSEKRNKLSHVRRFAFHFGKGPSAPICHGHHPERGRGAQAEAGSSTQPHGHGSRIPRPEHLELLGLRNCESLLHPREENRPGQLSSRPHSLHQLRQVTERGQAQLIPLHTEPPEHHHQAALWACKPTTFPLFPEFILGRDRLP